MSAFTNHKEEKITKLIELFESVIHDEMNSDLVREYREVISHATPADVIAVVDNLVHLKIPMPELKKGINKALNLLNKTLKEFP